jgi:hypothetical protein
MSQSPNDQSLREHVLYVLRGEGAHITFDDFVSDFPVERCGEHVAGLPYTAWQVLEHIRIALWDILEFSRDAKHVSPKWPEVYWPPKEQVGTPELSKFRDDLKEMQDLVANTATDLLAKIPHGSGQTILREALLVADHNSYHLGVLVAMGRTLQSTA